MGWGKRVEAPNSHRSITKGALLIRGTAKFLIKIPCIINVELGVNMLFPPRTLSPVLPIFFPSVAKHAESKSSYSTILTSYSEIQDSKF